MKEGRNKGRKMKEGRNKRREEDDGSWRRAGTKERRKEGR